MNAYIHIPFCRGKCAYCAFYSEPRHTGEQIQSYLNKLEADLEPWRGIRLDTLYFGGGTPTLLEPEDMRALFERVRTVFSFEPEAEISMECNPETMTAEKARVMGSFVNRVSMGVQSFSKEIRRRIGRASANDPDAPQRAFDLLRNAGIDNLGMDLIYAVPGQTMKDLEADLLQALRLKPNHLSAYALTLEEGTALARGNRISPVSDELSTGMWLEIGTILNDAGMPRYEISNYASESAECRHNRNIWHGQPYLGFGPSACGFDGIDRKTEASDLNRWLEGEKPEIDRIGPEARLREIFMMGLRTVRGWTEPEFQTVAGTGWGNFPEVRELIGEGLLIEERSAGMPPVIRPTEQGLLFWDTVAEKLILPG